MKTYTLEDALKLEAGPELDCLIAEKVFKTPVLAIETFINTGEGWSLWPGTQPSDWSCEAVKRPVFFREEWGHLDENPSFLDDNDKEFFERTGHTKHSCDIVDWYSISISAAWKVVEHCHLFQENWSLDLEITNRLYRNRDKKWAIGYVRGADHAIADTAPLAICRAALKACW